MTEHLAPVPCCLRDAAPADALLNARNACGFRPKIGAYERSGNSAPYSVDPNICERYAFRAGYWMAVAGGRRGFAKPLIRL